jgi:hypothetical protein
MEVTILKFTYTEIFKPDTFCALDSTGAESVVVGVLPSSVMSIALMLLGVE